jgi:hypothetical protein
VNRKHRDDLHEPHVAQHDGERVARYRSQPTTTPSICAARFESVVPARR